MVIRGSLLIFALVASAFTGVGAVWFPDKLSMKAFTGAVGAMTGVISALNLLFSALGLNQLRAERLPEPTVSTPSGTPSVPASPLPLRPSFGNGLYGGLIGGALAGLLIAGVYSVVLATAPQAPDRMILLGILLRIVSYAMVVGALVGVCSQVGILWCRRAVTAQRYPPLVCNDVSGGIAGGLVGGLVIGALGGVYFADLLEMDIPDLEMPFFLGPTLFGTMFIALGVLLYDYRGRWEHVRRALGLALLLTWLLACLAVVIFKRVGLDFEVFGQSGVLGGAILGGIVGFLMGVQIGLTLLAYRGWALLTEPTAR
jgi:hypothetical protein